MGLTVIAGQAKASCVTVKVCPAMVAVPVRCAPLFAATMKPTEPLPVPPVLSSMIQASLLTAVQAQPACVVTVTDPLPPAAAKFCDVGLMANEQLMTSV